MQTRMIPSVALLGSRQVSVDGSRVYTRVYSHSGSDPYASPQSRPKNANPCAETLRNLDVATVRLYRTGRQPIGACLR